MKINKYLNSVSIGFLVLSLLSCSHKEAKNEMLKNYRKFDSNEFIINDTNSTKKIRGQILYLPIYSNIPYSNRKGKFDLSSFIAIHNTDFKHSIKLTKVLRFDNEGDLVENYLSKDSVIKPLGAAHFFVPEEAQSGIGANFIVEWVSDSLVNEPLIESVIIGLRSGQGVSFLSTGKLLREIK